MGNKELFRLILIELMNNNLLNKFMNIIFGYNLTDKDLIYAQYKIVKNNLILDIFDNSKNKRFDAYIFIDNDISPPLEVKKEDKLSINYININSCYKKFKNNDKINNLLILGASLKVNNINEFNTLIRNIFPEEINTIIYNIIKKELIS